MLGLLRRGVRLLGGLVIGLVWVLLLVRIGLLRVLLLGIALLRILLPILLIGLGLLRGVVLLGLLLLVVGGWGRVILLLLLGVARLLHLGRRVGLLLGEEVELGAGEEEDREREGEDSAAEAVWGLSGILAGGARSGKCADGHRSLMAPQAFEMPVFSCSCAEVPLLAHVDGGGHITVVHLM